MKYTFSNEIMKVLKEAEEKNAEALETLIKEMVRTVREDRLIHTFGTGHGHMIGVELFARAGGLGNVDAMMDYDTLMFQGSARSGAVEKLCGLSDIIFDRYDISPGDIMIISSNSGRNAVPIEMAMRCRKEGVFTVALTNYEQSKQIESRHPSGKKLYECADLILDNCCGFGDCTLDFNGVKTGPASSLSGMFLLDIAASETIRRCLEEGIPVPVFQSQNLDGYNNEEIFRKYKNRVRHL